MFFFSLGQPVEEQASDYEEQIDQAGEESGEDTRFMPDYMLIISQLFITIIIMLHTDVFNQMNNFLDQQKSVSNMKEVHK